MNDGVFGRISVCYLLQAILRRYPSVYLTKFSTALSKVDLVLLSIQVLMYLVLSLHHPQARAQVYVPTLKQALVANKASTSRCDHCALCFYTSLASRKSPVLDWYDTVCTILISKGSRGDRTKSLGPVRQYLPSRTCCCWHRPSYHENVRI